MIFLLFLFFIICGDGAIDAVMFGYGVLGNHGRNRLKRSLKDAKDAAQVSRRNDMECRFFLGLWLI